MCGASDVLYRCGHKIRWSDSVLICSDEHDMDNVGAACETSRWYRLLFKEKRCHTCRNGPQLDDRLFVNSAIFMNGTEVAALKERLNSIQARLQTILKNPGVGGTDPAQGGDPNDSDDLHEQIEEEAVVLIKLEIPPSPPIMVSSLDTARELQAAAVRTIEQVATTPNERELARLMALKPDEVILA